MQSLSLLLGAALLLFLSSMPPRFAPASAIIAGSGVFGAISLFQLESRPFAHALALGAARARWWPPALITLIAWALYVLFHWLLDAVA